MRRVIIQHGPTGAGPAVSRAEVSGQRVKPAIEDAGDQNPSAAPVFAAPFSGPAPLSVDFAAYAGDIYVNPNGGTVNISQAIVWSPAP